MPSLGYSVTCSPWKPQVLRTEGCFPCWEQICYFLSSGFSLTVESRVWCPAILRASHLAELWVWWALLTPCGRFSGWRPFPTAVLFCSKPSSLLVLSLFCFGDVWASPMDFPSSNFTPTSFGTSLIPQSREKWRLQESREWKIKIDFQFLHVFAGICHRKNSI